jgi:hypothetical protein
LFAVALHEYVLSLSSPRTITGLAAAVAVLVVAPGEEHVTVNPTVAVEPAIAETLNETAPSVVFTELTMTAGPGTVDGVGEVTPPPQAESSVLQKIAGLIAFEKLNEYIDLPRQ